MKIHTENSFTISSESMTNTSSYTHYALQLLKEVIDQIIKDTGHYYLQVTITLKLGNIGDNMKEAKWLRLSDKIYLCLKRTRYQNTWVEEHDEVHQSIGN